jgi:hypothetical protein
MESCYLEPVAFCVLFFFLLQIDCSEIPVKRRMRTEVSGFVFLNYPRGGSIDCMDGHTLVA